MRLKWIHDDPETSADLEIWQYAQKLLLEQFRTLGADPASVDAVRVMRLTGTQNHKANPEILDRKVRVMSAESFAERKVTLKGLIEGLEASNPENPEEFNALIAERKKQKQKQPKIEKYIVCLKSEKEHPVLQMNIGNNPELIIETRQIREVLRVFFGTPNVKVSLSELEGASLKTSPEYIPSNYVVIPKCPGATFEEQNG